MTRWQKIRFGVISIIDALGLSFMTGFAIALSIYVLPTPAGDRPWKVNVVLISAALGFAFAVSMQVLRVYWSKNRTQRGIKALRATFLSPQCDLQTLCLGTLAAIVGVSAGVGWLFGSH